MFYRIQDSSRNVADLLNPALQVSRSYCTDRERAGVSVCWSLDDLAGYLAQTGLPFDESWTLVTLDGERSADTDEDADLGALLVHPAEIISTEPITARLWDMIEGIWDEMEA